jgi:hypothetical protein
MRDLTKPARPHVCNNGWISHLSSPSVSAYLSAKDLIAADYLLFLRSELGDASDPKDPHWRCYLAPFMTDAPRFLADAVRVTTARSVATAVGVGTAELLRERLVDRGRNFVNTYPPESRAYLYPFQFDWHSIATRP